MRELKEFMHVKNVECASNFNHGQPQILYLHEPDHHFKRQSVTVESEKSRGKGFRGRLEIEFHFQLVFNLQ